MLCSTGSSLSQKFVLFILLFALHAAMFRTPKLCMNVANTKLRGEQKVQISGEEKIWRQIANEDKHQRINITQVAVNMELMQAKIA